jgi:YegS/Rv2252/BmrU family lipid kinase
VRCVLIYNPVSGRNRSGRLEQLRSIADALAGLGHEAELIATTAAGSATLQAQKAVQDGVEVVFACGGDGTIHEIVQALVSESGDPRPALGIIPLGSANALARHLQISFDPVKAALEQIGGTARSIPVGKIECDGRVRYFTVMAGAGPDGALVYSMLARHKSNLGRIAYYLHAARLFATRRFPAFEVAYTEAATGTTFSRRAVSVMAARVRSLGGLFNRLTSHSANLEDRHLELVVLSPPAWVSLPLWFFCGWLRLGEMNRFLHSAQVSDFDCLPLSGPAAHCQADGEWLGRIPMHVSVVMDALRVLVPVRLGGNRLP